MLRPHAVSTPICPRCELPGVHNDDDCVAAYHAAIAAERPRAPVSPRPLPIPLTIPRRPAPKPKTYVLPSVTIPSDPAIPLTVNQACVLVQCTRGALYGWMRQGKVKWELAPNGARRIYRASLLRASRDAS